MFICKNLYFLDLRIEGQARTGEGKLTDEKKKCRKDREKGEQRGGRKRSEKRSRRRKKKGGGRFTK